MVGRASLIAEPRLIRIKVSGCYIPYIRKKEWMEGHPMTRLMLILFSMISTTMMGVGVIVALTIGKDTLTPIVIAAAIGFVLAVPVSYLVAKELA